MSKFFNRPDKSDVGDDPSIGEPVIETDEGASTTVDMAAEAISNGAPPPPPPGAPIPTVGPPPAVGAAPVPPTSVTPAPSAPPQVSIRRDEPTPEPETFPTAQRAEHAALEQVLYEVKKVIVGQDLLLEQLIVALLARGHVLVEGVPGLAKTLAIKTLADTIGGEFQRIQFLSLIHI